MALNFIKKCNVNIFLVLVFFVVSFSLSNFVFAVEVVPSSCSGVVGTHNEVCDYVLDKELSTGYASEIDQELKSTYLFDTDYSIRSVKLFWASRDHHTELSEIPSNFSLDDHTGNNHLSVTPVKQWGVQCYNLNDIVSDTQFVVIYNNTSGLSSTLNEIEFYDTDCVSDLVISTTTLVFANVDGVQTFYLWIFWYFFAFVMVIGFPLRYIIKGVFKI